jgi:hypothetical protein
MMTVRPTTPGFETSGSFWIKCPYPLVVLKIEARLKAAGYVWYGKEEPAKSSPSSIIYCPKKEDDAASEVERLRTAAGSVPILALGARLDPQLAQRVLLAGAAGYVHLERYPGQGAGFLSAAFEDETAIPRDYLEAILAEAVSRTGPIVLTSPQRRFLELVVRAPIIADNIMVPKELLGSFLKEPLSNIVSKSPVA